MAYGSKIEGSINNSKLAIGTLLIFALVAFIASLFFYFASLGKLAIIIILFIIFLKTKNYKLALPKLSFTKKDILLVLYLIPAGILIYLALSSVSLDIIKTPWQILPRLYLPLFFLATLLLIFLLNKKNSAPALAIHFFIFFSVAAFVYKFGYGFDQFVHEATQKYILDFGTITPKPLQYIGLYGINIFLNKTMGIGIEFLDKFLLPISSGILAIAVFELAKKSLNIKSPIAILSLLLFPLSYFIVTTPQGFANLLLIFFIFLSLNRYKKWFIPLAIFLIHPITGIAAFIYTALLRWKRKKMIMFVGALAIPLAFMLLSIKSSGTLNLHLEFKESFSHYWSLLTFGGFKQNFNFWLDIFYLAQYLLLPAIIILALWAARKYKKQISQFPLHIFLISTASFFITRIFIDFSYLIDYEQKNYPERIFYISILFLAPYFILAVQKMYSYISSPPPFKGGARGGSVLKLFFACLFALLITTNFYLTYPRYDDYQNDKGKNITSWMINSVNKIKKDASDNDYVVLSDQTISATALKIDGFKKYYNTPLGEVFYYPIPTGGPLYNEFLNLIYNNAGYRAVQNARTLTGAERAYVALPSYWENYEKIKEGLKVNMEVLYEDKNIVILK
ncbi:hypothetical protein KKB41_00735 [Patescibacteria group bacterium]|nr:hypothetical protein [Patescibacteria group bacterium]